MNKPLAALGLLVAGLMTVPAPADALALACPAPTAPLSGSLPSPVVPMTLSWLVTTSSCGTGTQFVSIAPPCTTAGAFPGEFCGPIKAPFAAAKCLINPGTPIFFGTNLYVGWDTDLDGNVLPSSGEGPVFGPIPPLAGFWLVPNPNPVPARVIAYPTSTIGAPIPIDLNTVICL